MLPEIKPSTKNPRAITNRMIPILKKIIDRTLLIKIAVKAVRKRKNTRPIAESIKPIRKLLYLILIINYHQISTI